MTPDRPLPMHALRLTTGASLLLAGLLTVASGCSGGGESAVFQTAGGDFFAIRSAPTGGAEAKLNDPVTIDFTTPVDLSSADLNAVQFQVFNLAGQPLQEQVTGTFSVGTSPNDTTPGRRLIFTPSFPTDDDYTNGGFRPARRYTVTLSSGSGATGTVIADVRNRGLQRPLSFSFRTPESTEIGQLFRDVSFGGPRVLSVETTPRDADDRVLLNEFGGDPVEVRVRFDQPLDPASNNLPIAISADPLVRASQSRGRIYLRYDDPDVPGTAWVPATVDLEQNTNSGATIVLRPIGLLPNNAEIEVVVERELRDLSGQSNVGNPVFSTIVSTFRTAESFEPQFDAVVERFNSLDFVDESAVFLEPRAEVQGGKVRASFEFEGNENILVYRPTNSDIVLNTSFTTISPVGSPPINVFGGEFRFREVEIPFGVTVTGTGPNPMVWLVNGDFTVNGTLTVSGGDGQRVNSLQSPNVPTSGGVGVCGGGNGGFGSPNATDRSPRGQFGFGPFQLPNGGGEGGRLGCVGSSSCGSGGGGGSFATEGDPYYPPGNSQRWVEVDGLGGGTAPGDCGSTNSGSAPQGGAPGPLAFTDSRVDNDFYGTGVNIAAGIRVEGELLAPRGGSGGGGGGDKSTTGCNSAPGTGFLSDEKGGGGGGGGGALIVKALGRITIGPQGRITANGGNGGGGEQAGSNERGGGGGGGSGGMVVLISGEGIDIYRDRGYSDSAPGRFDFAVSADGGICTQGEFSPPVIVSKYFNNTVGSATWGNREIGGFGGLGLVQLMTPPGDDLDGTNNRLDDNIRFLDPTTQTNPAGPTELPVSEKVRLLAWRGWRTGASGIDDAGNTIVIGRNEGAVRPSPILLPSTFGGVSRARSKWIDLGAANRRAMTTAPTGIDPRVVVTSGAAPGPDFRFAGTVTTGDPDQLGFAKVRDESAETAEIDFPQIAPASGFADIASVETGLVVEGFPAYALNFAPGTLAGVADDEFKNYRVELDVTDAIPDDFRILTHSGDRVVVEIDAFVPADQVQGGRILAKFYEVVVDGFTNLGPTLPVAFGSSDRAPRANVRIGFAFTTDPTDPSAPRWPDPTMGTQDSFEFNVDLDTNIGLRNFLQTNRPRFVQWDVLFDRQFAPGQQLNDEPVAPFPELEFLVLPFRY
jgi:hypothetical protein